MYKLTNTQIDSFHQKGWLEPLDIFSIQEVEFVKKEIESISKIQLLGKQKARIFENNHFGIKTSMNNHFDCKHLCNLFTYQRIIDVLNQLGEKNLLLWRTNISHRMPQQEGVDWHQAIEYFGTDVDETESELIFPTGEKFPNITVWIALEDITPEMGLLSFANCSHKERFKGIKVSLEQGFYQQEKYYKNLEAESDQKQYSKSFNFNENEWEIESIPTVKAGQVVIFTENVMHKVPSNYSSQERWVVIGRYVRPSVTVHPQRLTDNYIDHFGMDLRKHFCILVSGNDDYKINKVLPTN